MASKPRVAQTASVIALATAASKVVGLVREIVIARFYGTGVVADAFNLTNVWFANSYLAIDQGPEIIMIENYRSGLLWNLFMSCPEVKTGMQSLGFQSPNLN